MAHSRTLLGAQEVARALGLTRRTLHRRRREADFPEPVAELAATPVWTREQLVEYARARSEVFVERASVAAFAADGGGTNRSGGDVEFSPSSAFSPAEIAAELGMPSRWCEEMSFQLPVNRNLGTGEWSVPRHALAIWLRAAADRSRAHAEYAVIL